MALPCGLLLLATIAWAEFPPGGGGGGALDHFQLEDYGANGSDNIDDSEAFNRILSFFEPDTVTGNVFNGVIEIGEGSFYLDSTIVIQRDGVIIQGVGRADIGNWTRGTILRPRVTNSIDNGRDAFLVGGKSDSTVTRGVVVRDLTIRSDQTNRIGHCVHAVNVQGFTLERVDVYANSAYGGNGDGVYAAYYLESATNLTGGNAGTTANVALSCHFYCPKGLGGSGKGFGLLARTTGSGGFNTGNRFAFCRWSNAVSPGRSIFLTGHACAELEDCTRTGDVNEFTFTECRTDGSIGIEFCASSRNYWSGAIDCDPAAGDTALFIQSESSENTIRARMDGLFFDQQSNPNLRSSVWDPSWNEGPVVPGVALLPRTPQQFAAPLTGHPLSYPFMEADSTNKYVLLRWSNTVADTLGK